MKNLFFFLLLFFSSNVFAQSTPHGISFRAGIKTMNDFNIDQPFPAVVEVQVFDETAYTASLRYNRFFGQRLSVYAGLGFTFVSTGIDFSIPDEAEFRPGFGGGVVLDQAVSHVEFGGSYEQPVFGRLSLVAEAGGQLVSVKQGDGGGSQQSISQNGEPSYVSNYSFEENGDSGLALQLSPGVRYRIGSHIFLTVRGDFVFSNVKMLENGVVDGQLAGMTEPAVGSFDRPYASKGLDLMFTYHF